MYQSTPVLTSLSILSVSILFPLVFSRPTQPPVDHRRSVSLDAHLAELDSHLVALSELPSNGAQFKGRLADMQHTLDNVVEDLFEETIERKRSTSDNALVQKHIQGLDEHLSGLIEAVDGTDSDGGEDEDDEEAQRAVVDKRQVSLPGTAFTETTWTGTTSWDWSAATGLPIAASTGKDVKRQITVILPTTTLTWDTSTLPTLSFPTVITLGAAAKRQDPTTPIETSTLTAVTDTSVTAVTTEQVPTAASTSTQAQTGISTTTTAPVATTLSTSIVASARVSESIALTSTALADRFMPLVKRQADIGTNTTLANLKVCMNALMAVLGA